MSGDAEQQKSFEGTWLVTEYVYTPAGLFCGVIRQERRVEPVEPGRIRVTQECAPEAALAGGPMEAFAGRHVFDLIADGRARRYLGPAVLGTGLTWGPGAMTGTGMWPEFGHDFTSYAVVAEPTLQLTGGKFCNGPEMVANIIGVATPQTSADPEWPTLDGTELAHEVAMSWEGTLRTVKADGEVVGARRRHE